MQATVKRYNELAAKGEDKDFGKRPELMTSLDKPPYIALKIGGALMNIFGGLNIDEEMRVLDEKREPIPGLYAVGNTSGGLYAVGYPLVVPANSHGRCLTWGYIVGQSLKKY